MAIDASRLFSEGSDRYAASRPQYPRALFEYICALPRDRDRAWDCGTGSGQAAVALADWFTLVDGTDVSAEQISHAQPHDRVRYSVQPAEATTFEDESFSLVTVAQALHWFDFTRFWPEVQRVLKPGGIFAAWAYTWPHISKDVDRIVTAKLLDVIKGHWAPQTRLAFEGYANVALPFREIRPPQATMRLDWDLDQFLSYVGTWSATRGYIETNGSEFFSDLSTALEREWGERTLKREVVMEFHCRVGRCEA